MASYFSDNAGKLLALPFNVSTPILFYNKDAFRKAKLDPEKPPKTWYEMPKAMGALVEAGYECVYTTVWPSWVQIENMSTWHNQDFATRENGLAGLDAKLIFNTHLMVRHVSMLSSWARAGYFTYSGRRIEGERRFAQGECAMVTAASSSYAELRSEAKFDFGVAQLPYYDDITRRAAPLADRRRRPVGAGRARRAPSTAAWRASSPGWRGPRCRPSGTSAPATCRSRARPTN